jgi:invasion protein IalB
MAAAEGAWRADLTTLLVPLGLALPPPVALTPDGRRGHSESFRWLWGEFTSVRRSEGGVTW